MKVLVLVLVYGQHAATHTIRKRAEDEWSTKNKKKMTTK